MIKVLVIVEISVADNVADIFPFYSSNYKNIEEFIDSRINRLELTHPIEKFGYSTRVLDREEVKLLDIMSDEQI